MGPGGGGSGRGVPRRSPPGRCRGMGRVGARRRPRAPPGGGRGAPAIKWWQGGAARGGGPRLVAVLGAALTEQARSRRGGGLEAGAGGLGPACPLKQRGTGCWEPPDPSGGFLEHLREAARRDRAASGLNEGLGGTSRGGCQNTLCSGQPPVCVPVTAGKLPSVPEVVRRECWRCPQVLCEGLTESSANGDRLSRCRW